MFTVMDIGAELGLPRRVCDQYLAWGLMLYFYYKQHYISDDEFI